MTTTSSASLPFDTPVTGAWLTVDYPATYGPAILPFADALYISADCARECSATEVFLADSPCNSAWSVGQISMVSEIQTVTDEQVISSMLSEADDRAKTYLECICGDSTLEPWLAGPSGVCDETCSATGKDLEDLELVHSEFSSMCLMVGIEATTTAAGAEPTETDSESSETVEEQPEETQASDGEEAEGAVDDDSAAMKTAAVTLTGALFAGFLSACMLL